MIDGDTSATVAGFVVALAIIAGLLWVLGVGEVAAAVSRADLRVLGLMFAVAVAWLLAWGLALRTVLGILGIHVRVLTSFLVFAAATFANNVTPFGQAGGEPFSALLISRVADSEYETSLAAIASVDALNFVPSIGFSILAVGYFATEVTMSGRLEVAAVSVVLLGVGLVVGAVLGWRYRYEVEHAVVRVFTPFIRALASVVPRWSPPTSAGIERRIEGFFTTIDRVAADRSSLVVALSLSAAGWFAIMTSLWLSLYAIGHAVPFAAVMLAVPLGSVAGVTPLPGGLGGIEAVLVAVLVPTTALTPTTVAAAVLIHRVVTYVFPLALGGGAATILGSNGGVRP